VNRTIYFNYVEEKLNLLGWRISSRGKLNILDLNLHAESFYLGLFNIIYGYSLKNMNEISQNAEAIDLIDISAKTLVQVSATSTKEKIESALEKDLAKYKGWDFKFISIANDSSSLRKKNYKNPHNLNFVPSIDIHDISSILSTVLHSPVDKQRELYEFIKNELGHETDALAVESNLATVIGILAKEDLSSPTNCGNPIAFNVDEKLVFNNLDTAKDVVEDYKIHHGRINKIYSEFDKAGQNKSLSVLNGLRKSYTELRSKYSADELFFNILDTAIMKVRKSSNHIQIPDEELELCVSIIAVDAFIRCKIFKNPEVKQNAAS